MLPITQMRDDFFSKESRLACPVHLPKCSLRQDSHLHLTAYETAALLLCYGAQGADRLAPVGYEADERDEVPFTSRLHMPSYRSRG